MAGGGKWVIRAKYKTERNVLRIPEQENAQPNSGVPGTKASNAAQNCAR